MKDQKQSLKSKKNKQKSQTSEYNNELSDSHSCSLKDNVVKNELLKLDSNIS